MKSLQRGVLEKWAKKRTAEGENPGGLDAEVAL